MKAESTVTGVQVFAGKRVPTTGRQYCIRKPKTKTKPLGDAAFMGAALDTKATKLEAKFTQVANQLAPRNQFSALGGAALLPATNGRLLCASALPRRRSAADASH